MRLCLNMIVRNEEALIADCIKSALPYISCWAITDTGSSDNTPEIVMDTLSGIPGCLTTRAFTNFSESRNYALDDSKHFANRFDYYLFLDADHQLVASDPEWHRSLSHDAYLLLQKSGDFSYRSVRLLRKGVKAHYIGATHEYLSVEGEVWALDEIFILDSGRGSNRKDKLFRDRDLLERELRRAPSPRTVYYLAQTYRDLGNYKQAAQLYRQRAGIDESEEAWRAQLEYSRCLLADKKDSKFIHQSLATYGRRPSRAEPLNDLARFFIDEGKHATALLFTELGMKLPKPDKELEVVDDWIYDYGFREAYSVAARSNGSGLQLCDELSLAKNIPKSARNNARNNLYYYCEPIDKHIGSWRSKRLTFEPPSGYSQMNCSVTNLNDRLLLMERTITYTVDGMGNYKTADNEHSRNFLLDVDPNTLNDMLMYEVHSPIDFPPPQNSRVGGWEDLRLFEWKGDLWTIGCVCEQNEEGMAEQYVARVNNYLDKWQRLIPMATPVQHEKNWMPLSNGSLSYVYSCDPVRVLDWNANKVLIENETMIAAEHFRGGSQLVAYGDGYLAIIHSVSRINNVSWYYHRFITFDHDINIDRISQPFIFTPGDQQKQGYQYAMGLCWHPDDSRLVVSYQTDECRSWLGTFEAADLSGFLRAV